MQLVRNRKPTYRQIRKAIRQQLNYIQRDLQIVRELLLGSERNLCPKQQQYLKVIEELYYQQKTMYDNKVHKIEHRIVSIHQPCIRPIVRGKATANVELGAKISISMTDGYTMIENVNWEAFNEAGDLQGICERYKDRTGHYPERILGDKIYRNRTNLQYCEKHNIRMNGPKLGRPPKDPVLYTQQKRMERQESGERNAVEGKFGEGKRFSGWAV